MQPLLTNVKEYSIHQIAEILPIKEQQIRNYIWDGSLKADKRRNRWIVSKDNLQAFIILKGFTTVVI